MRPGNHVAWLNKALVQEDLGRLQDAIDSYRTYLTIVPPGEMAEIARANGRLKDALTKLLQGSAQTSESTTDDDDPRGDSA